MATDPAVDDQPHPADSEHLVLSFFARLGRKRTHEVGERASSEQFLLGRYRIGSVIPDERRLELLAGGRPLFPQELRRSFGQATIYPSPDCSGASRHRTRIELLQRTATAPT